jgi:error-prone DNA polymerase
MNKRALTRIAESGALASLGFDLARLDRRSAIWELHRLANEVLQGLDWETKEEPLSETKFAFFEALERDEAIAWDYRSSLHSTAGHPMEAYRERLIEAGYPEASAVANIKSKQRIRYAGLVICRQRPATATGVVFMTLEDETGFVNVVIWNDIFEKHKLVAKTSVFLEVRGQLQEESGVVHLIAESIRDLASILKKPSIEKERTEVPSKSRDFH